MESANLVHQTVRLAPQLDAQLSSRALVKLPSGSEIKPDQQDVMQAARNVQMNNLVYVLLAGVALLFNLTAAAFLVHSLAKPANQATLVNAFHATATPSSQKDPA